MKLILHLCILCIVFSYSSHAEEAAAKKTLEQILPTDKELPKEIQLAKIPENTKLPYGMTSNPFASSNKDFIQAFSKDVFKKQFVEGEITEGLFVIYKDKNEIGVFAFKFNTNQNAEKALELLRETMKTRATKEQQIIKLHGNLVLFIWSDEEEPQKNIQLIEKLLKAE